MKSSVFGIGNCLVGLGLLGAWGCTGTDVSSSLSSGSVAVSSDDAFVYAVDKDNGVVGIIDSKSLTTITTVPVGNAPERIVVGPDDTLYVTNRGGRSVSVIRRGASDPGSWKEAARLSVGVEPVGLTLSPDGKTLYVVNSASLQAAEYGTVMAFDTASLQMDWELPVGEEPRGIALIGNNKAVVTLFKQGDIAIIDLSKPELIQSGTTLYQEANRPDPSNGNFGGPTPPVPQSTPIDLGTGTFHPRGMSEVVAGPHDGRVYALVSWSSEATLFDPPSTDGGVLPTDPVGVGAGYGSFGCGGSGAVVSAGVVTFAGQGQSPIVDSLQGCTPTPGIPPTRLTSPTTVTTPATGSNLGAVPQPSALQGPVAAAIDKTGAWMFVVNQNSNNIAVVSTQGAQGKSPAILAVVPVGEGPSGIALSHDGQRAYVYNSFDHTMSVLDSQNGQVAATDFPTVQVAQDVLPTDVIQGRKLFFSATDTRMTSTSVGIACASCHLEAREDGHVWHFNAGPRRTPSLAGRMITKTAPFHWSGQFATLSDFLDHTIGARMGGSAIGDSSVEVQIGAFIDSLQEPENPYQLASPSAAQIRGRAVFEAASCNTCHSGTAHTGAGNLQLFTNNGFANVGTLVTTGDNPDDPTQLPNGLNVPSLLGLARAAPYLHDGSAATYVDRLRVGQSSNQHGQTANLTDQQLDDLVSYLKSL
jgi:YVTN family beta-propeller protein